MIHGLGEGDDFELTFVHSADPEVAARLKKMEAILLAELQEKGPIAGPRPQSPKEKILSHLKAIEEDD